MMDYMMYITKDAQMLQFYLWFCGYQQRFEALSEAEKAKSPEWNFDINNLPFTGWPFEEVDLASPILPNGTIRPASHSLSGITEVSLADITGLNIGNPWLAQLDEFPSPPKTAVSVRVPDTVHLKKWPSLHKASESLFSGTTALVEVGKDASSSKTSESSNSPNNKSNSPGKTSSEYTPKRANAVGLLPTPGKPRLITVPIKHGSLPFASKANTVQPFRAEVIRFTSLYLAEAAPRKLSLNHATLASVLHALEHTTHPSAFAPIVDLVDTYIRHCAHPNFIRWSICNGNKPRVFFVRTMGIIHILLGLLLAFFILMSSLNRFYRLLAIIPLFIGLATLFCALSGLCIILGNENKRTLKPWEDPIGYYNAADPELQLAPAWRLSGSTAAFSQHEGFDIFGVVGDMDSTVWAQGYKRKSMWKKVFDDTVVVHEQVIKVMQDRIVMQAQLWAAIVTVLVMVIFVPLAPGNAY